MCFSLDKWLENETAVFFLRAWRHCFLNSKNFYDGQVQILRTVLQTAAATNELGFTYRPLNIKNKDISITLWHNESFQLPLSVSTTCEQFIKSEKVSRKSKVIWDQQEIFYTIWSQRCYELLECLKKDVHALFLF